MLAQGIRDAQFAVQERGRNRQAHSEIRAKKVGLVTIVKCVGGKWGMAFERRIITKLDEFAFKGIDLCESGYRADTANP